jgi:hypothetical protein
VLVTEVFVREALTGSAKRVTDKSTPSNLQDSDRQVYTQQLASEWSTESGEVHTNCDEGKNTNVLE